MRSIVGVAKTNLPIFDGFQAAVGDSDAENMVLTQSTVGD
jgi:hypothetical protein